MVNPWAGEVEVTLDGVPRVARLTLGSLVEMEAGLGAGSLIEVVERFEQGRFTARDVIAVLVAGLRGGGWKGTAADLARSEVAGGPMAAARLAAQLLARAFALPGEDGCAASTGPG